MHMQGLLETARADKAGWADGAAEAALLREELARLKQWSEQVVLSRVSL